MDRAASILDFSSHLRRKLCKIAGRVATEPILAISVSCGTRRGAAISEASPFQRSCLRSRRLRLAVPGQPASSRLQWPRRWRSCILRSRVLRFSQDGQWVVIEGDGGVFSRSGSRLFAFRRSSAQREEINLRQCRRRLACSLTDDRLRGNPFSTTRRYR